MFFSEFIFELEKKVYAKSAFLPALIGAGVLSICAPYCIMMCYLAVHACPTILVSVLACATTASVLSFIKGTP